MIGMYSNMARASSAAAVDGMAVPPVVDRARRNIHRQQPVVTGDRCDTLALLSGITRRRGDGLGLFPG